MRVLSLRTRLIAGSLALIFVALLATGVVLVILFRVHIERRFDQSLHDHLLELTAAAEVGVHGELALSWEPTDPRFKAPLSGWYWELRAVDRTIRSSTSLSGGQLNVSGPGPGQPHTIVDTQWPNDECLRVIAQDIQLPQMQAPVTVLVAGPRVDIRQDVRSFAGMLAASLGILATGLVALVFAQVGYGLRPLRNVQNAINEIRHGARARLSEDGGPSEVRPLIDEVNALIDQRQDMIERARAEAGDLADALKTPIAIIANEAGQVSGESGEVLKSETERLRRVVEHHLIRARAAAGFFSPEARASVEEVFEDVRFTLARLNPEIALTVTAPSGLYFAGQADDLGEMIGNLTDNAAKWGRRQILITGRSFGDRLYITVEDDGPGLDEANRSIAIGRGQRLDTAKRGHGLGLSIVAHLAELYGGQLHLSCSKLGGLQSELDLPASRCSVERDGATAAHMKPLMPIGPL